MEYQNLESLLTGQPVESRVYLLDGHRQNHVYIFQTVTGRTTCLSSRRSQVESRVYLLDGHRYNHVFIFQTVSGRTTCISSRRSQVEPRVYFLDGHRQNHVFIFQTVTGRITCLSSRRSQVEPRVYLLDGHRQSHVYIFQTVTGRITCILISSMQSQRIMCNIYIQSTGRTMLLVNQSTNLLLIYQVQDNMGSLQIYRKYNTNHSNLNIRQS